MKQVDSLKSIVDAAIKKAGSKTALGEYLNVSRQAVGQWKRIPLDHVVKIAEFLGLNREEVRPDVYG